MDRLNPHKHQKYFNTLHSSLSVQCMQQVDLCKPALVRWSAVDAVAEVCKYQPFVRQTAIKINLNPYIINHKFLYVRNAVYGVVRLVDEQVYYGVTSVPMMLSRSTETTKIPRVQLCIELQIGVIHLAKGVSQRIWLVMMLLDRILEEYVVYQVGCLRVNMCDSLPH
jgi:hypothetical protein